ncbi:hypothetical protein BEL04_02620 [Mucilaginibacter sp. PPCGB 2223]|uniref:DUF1223 domain-containing protein n=1 Tax=Mucilaginibacter sp. PPCGB 2223 TaxID=1886027 RepID=UPI0008253907|nr:DUF1223 domain-containing protein [Mucilaginibacter sp. PPCGB 2223]OCX53220.1 hypothetical protein BEL04_02620 [Mucilaginibacter sp. PPCGB 2223]
MKTYKIAISVLLLIAGLFSLAAFRTSKKTNTSYTGNGFALIELFTSEGCSSCLPADELVARVQKETKDKPVYILAYHVDYWNNLGWKDQFSSAVFSQRQRQYAAWLNAEVYTPQIVVNGKREFVGSEDGTLHNAIQTGLQKTDNNSLTFSNIRIDHSELNVQYQTRGGNALLIAFVLKSASTQVKHGENGGRTLSHINIVKSLNAITLHQPNGNASLHLPEGYNPQTWDIIGFVQNTSTGEVLSAQRITAQGV